MHAHPELAIGLVAATAALIGVFMWRTRDVRPRPCGGASD